MTGIIKVDTIQNNGGTTGLTIDSSGNVTASGIIYPKGLSYWPSCSYHKTSTQTASSAPEKISFQTKLHDNGDNFSTSTSLFTCPIAGVYIASCVILTESDTTGSNYGVYLNSSLMSRNRTGTSSGHQSETLTAHLNASANDTIHFAITTSGHKAYGDSNVWTTMHITYVGG